MEPRWSFKECRQPRQPRLWGAVPPVNGNAFLDRSGDEPQPTLGQYRMFREVARGQSVKSSQDLAQLATNSEAVSLGEARPNIRQDRTLQARHHQIGPGLQVSGRDDFGRGHAKPALDVAEDRPLGSGS